MVVHKMCRGRASLKRQRNKNGASSDATSVGSTRLGYHSPVNHVAGMKLADSMHFVHSLSSGGYSPLR